VENPDEAPVIYFFMAASVVAVLLIAAGVGILVGRAIRQRDTQIPREDEES
jgi:hypothetical protein